MLFIAAHLVGGVCVASVFGQDQRAVALTFDDLPTVAAGPEADARQIVTRRLLATLRAHGAPAIGFVNEAKLESDGEMRPERAALLQAWLNEGHRLGNHTYSHRWLYEATPAEFIEEIERGELVWRPLMREHWHDPVHYFRHPRLNTGRTVEDRAAVEEYLTGAGYAVAPVTIDNYDFQFANAYARSLEQGQLDQVERVAEAYVQYMDTIFGYYERQSELILGRQPRQILLLHANRLNADVLDRVLAMVRRRGYRFITLPEALEDPAYERQDTYVGQAGITWLHRWAISADADRGIFRGEPTVPDWVVEASRR